MGKNKSTAELLADLDTEASDARSDMGGAKTGLRRKGEVAEDNSDEDELDDDIEDDEEDESEQENLENKSDEDEDELDEDEEAADEEADDEQDEASKDRRGNPDNAARRVLAKKDETIAELQARIKDFEKAKTQEEQDDILSEIKPLADELKLDTTGLGKIIQKTVEITERRLKARLPSDEDMLAQREQREEREESTYFESEEWKPFVPDLLKTYPRATAKQLESAKDLMDQLAHSPTGGRVIKGKDGKERLVGHPLEYIMYKNKNEFDRILSNSRRHGLESANVASYENDSDDADTSSSRGIDALDRKYRNVESESSGLRRGRSPRNRSI